MSKVIKYSMSTKVNHGTTGSPVWKEIITPVIMGWSEVNEEIAKREAHNGEYVIDEDEQEVPSMTQEERIAELEDALELLLSEATE